MPPPLHIIVADDHDTIRAMIARVLIRTYPAVAISAVSDGAQALLVYGQRGADLLITDHHMPILSGLDLVRTLRAQQVAIPIVLISSDHTVEPSALAVGANRFLLKPFSVSALQQVVLALLPI
jgi:two-component system, NarL family, capsular synthesis sensor histidine kinase RcsC